MRPNPHKSNPVPKRLNLIEIDDPDDIENFENLENHQNLILNEPFPDHPPPQNEPIMSQMNTKKRKSFLMDRVYQEEEIYELMKKSSVVGVVTQVTKNFGIGLIYFDGILFEQKKIEHFPKTKKAVGVVNLNEEGAEKIKKIDSIDVGQKYRIEFRLEPKVLGQDIVIFIDEILKTK